MKIDVNKQLECSQNHTEEEIQKHGLLIFVMENTEMTNDYEECMECGLMIPLEENGQ